MNETNFITNKNKLPFAPIVFLLITVIITISLFFYNYYLNSKNNEILANIESREISIKELNSDTRIQVYSLLEANSYSFFELEKRNKITLYISHLEKISNDYWLRFDWFNFSDWKLTTTVFSETTESSKLGYNKTVDFIREYRKNSDSLFDLEFINSVEWSADSMKYNISLNLK